ncbi:SPOR domain-containing protein [Helicobacter burdigaliensis]|uniref:SPOR domain-containing protein n=1 Tax=Helicobacter burdigaliensis TaxID=2315334 RepID=UPI000EF648AD|nr:SPOR domain-containing protein [Helicobacter burdigaliensis]
MSEIKIHKDEKEEGIELNDLLISDADGEEIKSGSSKKIMLLGAIIVILFAAIIFIIYLMQGEDTNKVATQAPVQTEKVEMPQNLPPIQAQDDKQMPIQANTDIQTSNSDEQFQRIIEQIKSQQAGNATNNTQATTQKPKEPVKPQEPVAPAIKEQAKEEAKSPKDTFKQIQANNPQEQGAEATKGFYIQVGSFSKYSPNKQLMNAISKEQLSYRMQKAGDTNRLLIGPFNTRAEAKAKLEEVKAKINKDAFIKEIK